MSQTESNDDNEFDTEAFEAGKRLGLEVARQQIITEMSQMYIDGYQDALDDLMDEEYDGPELEDVNKMSVERVRDTIVDPDAEAEGEDGS